MRARSPLSFISSTVLLWWCGARAMAGEPVDTTLGTFSSELVEGFCRSPNIVVGTVETVTSFMEPNTPRRTLVASHSYVRVNYTVRSEGPAPTGKLLHIPMFGGTFNGIRTGTPSGMMLPVVGAKYVFGYTRLPQAHGYAAKGDPLIWAFLYLDPDASGVSLSSYQAAFSAFLEDHCGT